MPLAAQAHVSSAKKGYFPSQPLPNVETGLNDPWIHIGFFAQYHNHMAIGSILSGIGSLFSGGAAIGGAASSGSLNKKNREWQEKMNLRQFQQQKDLTKYTNDLERETTAEYWKQYNSPSAQRAAYRAAGINPFVEGSALQSVPASTSPSAAGSPGTPTPSTPYNENPWSAIGQAASSFTQAALSAEKISAEVGLIKAQKAKTESETIAQNNENSLFGMVRQSAQLDVLSKQYRAALDAINVEWASIEKMQDAAQKDAATQELLSRVKSNLANAAKTDADRENQKILTSALENMYKSSATLSEEQAKTEGVKRENIAAQTENIAAQTETENALREGRIKINERQARQILNEIGLTEAKTLNEYEDLVRAMTNTKEVSSLWGYVDKLAARISRKDGTASYSAAEDLRTRLLNALVEFQKKD